MVQASFGSGTLPRGWTTYNGHYGGTTNSYASPSHAYVRGGVLHLLASYDDSGSYGRQWYTGGVCICGDASFSSVSARVTFRYRVVDAGAPPGISYAFLRWPDSEQWPVDGEEDFAEGAADPSSRSFTTTLHHADTDGQDVNSPQWTVPVSAIGGWHTVQYTRRDNKVLLSTNGTNRITYSGDSTSLPATLKHVVFQQQCFDVCPTEHSGAVDVQVDDIQIQVPTQ